MRVGRVARAANAQVVHTSVHTTNVAMLGNDAGPVRGRTLAAVECYPRNLPDQLSSQSLTRWDARAHDYVGRADFKNARPAAVTPMFLIRMTSFREEWPSGPRAALASQSSKAIMPPSRSS
jgi:hypothetical protein